MMVIDPALLLNKTSKMKENKREIVYNTFSPFGMTTVKVSGLFLLNIEETSRGRDEQILFSFPDHCKVKFICSTKSSRQARDRQQPIYMPSSIMSLFMY